MAAETIGDVAPQVTQTFSALQSDFFFPLAIGFSVFLLASGLAMLRTGLFPAWMGWAAVVLGVLSRDARRLLRDPVDARGDHRRQPDAVHARDAGDSGAGAATAA